MERTNQPLTNEAARKLMALDVQDKEILTYEKLDEWYTAWGGQCYVSFSGGKDSTVLVAAEDVLLAPVELLSGKKLAEEINEGRIKRKHIKDVLKDECGVVFGD